MKLQQPTNLMRRVTKEIKTGECSIETASVVARAAQLQLRLATMTLEAKRLNFRNDFFTGEENVSQALVTRFAVALKALKDELPKRGRKR